MAHGSASWFPEKCKQVSISVIEVRGVASYFILRRMAVALFPKNKRDIS